MAIFNTVYGGEPKWKPGSNTIAYYPLTSTTTVNDMKGSGTAYNLTSKGTSPTFGTYGGVDCAYFSNSGMLYNGDWTGTALGDYTISLFYNKTADVPQDSGLVACLGIHTTNNTLMYAEILDGKTRPTSTKGIYGLHDATSLSYVGPYSISGWTHIVITLKGSVGKLYINGEQKGNTFTIGSATPNLLLISRYQAPGSSIDRSIRGYVSEVIFENKGWGDAEIISYYSQKKSKYGL